MKALTFLKYGTGILLPLLYLGIHLYTLPLWPLPWFDETVFASVAHTLATEGRMVATVANHHFQDLPFLLHGPVYHSVCAVFIKLLGMGPFAFRLTALLAGMLSACVLYRLIRHLHPGARYVAPVAGALLALDPFYNLCMHEGRPETLGVLLALAGVLAGLRARHAPWAGLLWAAAYLCTPRTLVWILPFGGFVFIRLLGTGAYRQAALLCLAVLLPVAVWIYGAHGGPVGYFNYYATANTGAYSVDAGYLLPQLRYIPRHSYLLIAVAAAVLLLSLAAGRVSRLQVLSGITLCLFYLIFRDLGPYSALVVPAWYLLIFAGPLPAPGSPASRVLAGLMGLLLIFNAGFFIVKNADVLADTHRRQPAVAAAFVKKHVPPGARAVGDPVYYYACLDAGAEYRLADKFGTPENRERILREDYNYEYLLISRQEAGRNAESISLFFAHADREPVDVLTFQEYRPLLHLPLSRHEQYGYEGEIYKRDR